MIGENTICRGYGLGREGVSVSWLATAAEGLVHLRWREGGASASGLFGKNYNANFLTIRAQGPLPWLERAQTVDSMQLFNDMLVEYSLHYFASRPMNRRLELPNLQPCGQIASKCIRFI